MDVKKEPTLAVSAYTRRVVGRASQQYWMPLSISIGRYHEPLLLKMSDIGSSVTSFGSRLWSMVALVMPGFCMQAEALCTVPPYFKARSGTSTTFCLLYPIEYDISEIIVAAHLTTSR